MWFCVVLLETIEQFLPVQGHSYLHYDTDFAIIERKFKTNRIYSMHQYIKMIASSSAKNNFVLHEVHPDNNKIDFKNRWPTYILQKRLCIQETWKYQTMS